MFEGFAAINIFVYSAFVGVGLATVFLAINFFIKKIFKKFSRITEIAVFAVMLAVAYGLVFLIALKTNFGQIRLYMFFGLLAGYYFCRQTFKAVPPRLVKGWRKTKLKQNDILHK